MRQTSTPIHITTSSVCHLPEVCRQIYSEAADVKLAYEQRKAAEGANFTPLEKKEIVALIAYLQRLGTDIKTTEIKTASSN